MDNYEYNEEFKENEVDEYEIYYNINSEISDLLALVKSMKAEDRHGTEVTILKIKDVLTKIDSEYGKLSY